MSFTVPPLLSPEEAHAAARPLNCKASALQLLAASGRLRLPCAKGAGKNQRFLTEGLSLPSRFMPVYTTQPLRAAFTAAHLPLHRGGFVLRTFKVPSCRSVKKICRQPMAPLYKGSFLLPTLAPIAGAQRLRGCQAVVSGLRHHMFKGLQLNFRFAVAPWLLKVCLFMPVLHRYEQGYGRNFQNPGPRFQRPSAPRWGRG